MILMYKGKDSVKVHPSQVDTMLIRGWKDKKPAATKPKKVTKVEADNG